MPELETACCHYADMVSQEHLNGTFTLSDLKFFSLASHFTGKIKIPCTNCRRYHHILKYGLPCRPTESYKLQLTYSKVD